MERLLHTLTPNRRPSEGLSPPVPVHSTVSDDSTRFGMRSRGGSSVEPSIQPGTSDYYSDRATPEMRNVAEDSVDGLGTITFADEASSGFFGATSNTAFLQRVVVAQSTSSRFADLDPAGLRGFSRPASPPLGDPGSYGQGPQSVDPFMLPPYSEMSRLVDVYFENTGRFWPYLYKPRVLKNLTNMRSAGFRSIERSHLCVLNLMFAFASTHCPSQVPVTIKLQQGDIYLQRALALLSDIRPSAENPESIQALLLATMYLQGTQRSSQTWDVLGRLITAVFRVGLFREVAGETALDAELRKRTWWTCFVMNMTISMTLGRPPPLPTTYMTTELPSEIDLGRLAGDTLNGCDSSIPTASLLVETSKMYLVLGKVIERVYEANVGPLADNVAIPKLMVDVLQADQELSAFAAALPPALRIISSTELSNISSPTTDPQAHRFRLILTVRLLNVRLLLHRRVLSYVLSQSRTDTNSRDSFYPLSVAGGSLDLCVDAALETIAIISQTTQPNRLLPIWWWSAYFSFTAALTAYGVLVATYKCGLKIHRCSTSDMINALQQAFDVLGLLGGDTRQVLRCQKIIRHLIQVVWTLYPQNQNPAVLPTAPKAVPQPALQMPNLGLPAMAQYDWNSGIDPGFTLENLDFSSFPDDVSSLFPDGF
ncbi:hypothetical protein LTR62_005110 [Meristemomyces frigidus]|uniref:Xylanolytic transcriptional activator regulatory domain-containing protein n=1 Tax=Meristemomyces frigidus TaxID=1508187 RepID=A0AAN7YKF2_9PEZI|nr:hypothetical protein LTR62_005110 [Meristemomyces frigidus]